MAQEAGKREGETLQAGGDGRFSKQEARSKDGDGTKEDMNDDDRDERDDQKNWHNRRELGGEEYESHAQRTVQALHSAGASDPASCVGSGSLTETVPGTGWLTCFLATAP